MAYSAGELLLFFYIIYENPQLISVIYSNIYFVFLNSKKCHVGAWTAQIKNHNYIFFFFSFMNGMVLSVILLHLFIHTSAGWVTNWRCMGNQEHQYFWASHKLILTRSWIVFLFMKSKKTRSSLKLRTFQVHILILMSLARWI